MNKDHGITPENLLNSLPAVLRNDKNLSALATSIANVLSARGDEIRSLSIYPRIDELPADLLDILAHDFKVDWYWYNYPLDIKRNLIKSSFNVHRRLGTRGAIEDALHSLYQGIGIEEWFEYGGEPYYFRIVLNVTEESSDISHDEIVRAINIYKSLRSRLEDDAIFYRTRSIIGIKTSCGCAQYSTRLCGTYPNRATQGSIESGTLSVDAEIGGTAYSVKMCGTALGSI